MHCLVSKGSIHYEMVGIGFPIVILHSMGTDHRAMKAWLEPIFDEIQGFQRVYVDLPAHGFSEIDDQFHSSEDMMLNLLDFIDQTIPNQMFSLIGFSYGGYLAQGLLHVKKESVKSICLLAPAIHRKIRNLPEKEVHYKAVDVINRLDPEIKLAFETLMTIQNEENLNTFLTEIQPGRLLANKEFLMSNWRENGYYFSKDPLQDVKEVLLPALFILGKQDSICGYKDHFELLEKYKHASFSVLDQAGHMLHIEKRPIVQELIRDWLTRTTIS